MKKSIFVLSICLGLLISMGMVRPAFAMANFPDNVPGVEVESRLLPEDCRESIGRAPAPRGTYIDSGLLGISDPGNGLIDVMVLTTAHVAVDEISMRVYLDRWIEDEERWAMIDTLDFNFLKEDEPDQVLSSKILSFSISGQPANCYYRLRGLHLVRLGDDIETLSSKTDGILITK